MIISMKKIFSRNKGFTLVECIIAVAVFGLMSLVVFMILTNASVRATKASESEENLAQLIENVVGDETYKKFDPTDANPKVMTLSVDNVNGASGSGALTISYNVISGYKNFIECPDCAHQGNFTDFMSTTPGIAGDATSMTPTDSLSFNVSTDHFVCPDCYHTVSFTLRCPDCSTTGAYNALSSSSASGHLFTFINSQSGGFECSICGSTAVMAVDAAGNFISEKAAADGLSVSGIVANGIRYGESIDWPSLDRTALCKFHEVNPADPTDLGTAHSNTFGGIQVSLSYTGSANSSYAGKYHLQLSVYSKPTEIGSSPYFIELAFPTGYTPRYDATVYTNVRTGTKTLADGKTYPTLVVSCPAGSAGSIFSGSGMEFTLTSNESGYSFEYDYMTTTTDDEQGLFRWFGFTSVPTFGRTAEGYLLSGSANGYIGS